jgi:glycerophosphoryl diester phosphodiesterase
LDVYVWTVNDLATAEKLVAIGVSGIITDDPGLISSIRDTQ